MASAIEPGGHAANAPEAPAVGEAAAVVAELWRFPVKSMQGNSLAACLVAQRGVVGDRAYAVRDLETGEAVGGRALRRFPRIVECAARFLSEPAAGREPPPVEVALGDGTVVRSDDPRCDAVLSAFFGRPVALTRDAGDGLGAAAFEQFLGLPAARAGGAFQAMFPVSVMSRATWQSLRAARPESAIGVGRLRMNVVVETPDGGYPERGWLGRSLATAGGVRLRVTVHNPGSVGAAAPPQAVPRDPAVLRAEAHPSVRTMGAAGPEPRNGVYATVEAPGELRVGETVWLGA